MAVARTLVLLHGLTDSGASWADAVRRWTAAGWTVVAPDARGHGSAPRWTADRIAARPGEVMADDVATLLTDGTVGDGSVALVGHSMGAAVAVAAAARVPGRVWAVVAEDPPWSLPPRGPDPVRAAEWVRDHDRDQATPRQERIDRQRAESPRWPQVELPAWAEAKEQVDRALLASGDILPTTPWPNLVTATTAAGVPLLVVTGTRDVRVDARAEAEARARGAVVVRLRDAGHCVRRDDVDGYHRVVDPFLTDRAPGP